MNEPLIWILDAAGGVETFFPCALGAEPALPPGYSLSREPPQAPSPAVQAPLVPLSAVIDQFSDTEIAAALSRPEMMRALFTKLAEAADSQVNPQSERLRMLLASLGLPDARIAELLQAPVA